MDKVIEEIKESNPDFQKNLNEMAQLQQKVKLGSPMSEEDQARCKELLDLNQSMIRKKIEEIRKGY